MNKNELRIGNWYTYADCDGIAYRTIKEIKFNEFGFLGDYDGVNFGICKPIPLTEEWLLKFGFEGCENEFWFAKNILSISPSVGHFEISGSKLSFAVMRNIKIQYVHQLQNLYFALTGEELTIKV